MLANVPKQRFRHDHLVVRALSFQKRPQSSKSDQRSHSYRRSRGSCFTWTFWSILNGHRVLFAFFALFLVPWTHVGPQIWTAHVPWVCWHTHTAKSSRITNWPARDRHIYQVVLDVHGHNSATMGLICKILADYQCQDQDASCDTFG